VAERSKTLAAITSDRGGRKRSKGMVFIYWDARRDLLPGSARRAIRCSWQASFIAALERDSLNGAALSFHLQVTNREAIGMKYATRYPQQYA